MYRSGAQTFIAMMLTGCLTHGFAAGPAIGIAMASGTFRIDRSEVKGNASLFDGSEVSTAEASSKLRINGGARLEIGAASQAKVFATHAVLERGAGQVESARSYPLEARTLRINAGAQAIARVQLDGPDAVLVSAVNGPVRVSTASGIVVARLAAGHSFRFQTQTTTPDAFEVTGCLLRKNGRFIIVDQTTSQVFELTGTNLTPELGNRVTVKGRSVAGATPIEGAAQVIAVGSLMESATGGCLATAAAVNADPPPGATATGSRPPVHEGGGPNKAVIAGVVIAGGAAAGIALGVSGKSKSP